MTDLFQTVNYTCCYHCRLYMITLFWNATIIHIYKVLMLQYTWSPYFQNIFIIVLKNLTVNPQVVFFRAFDRLTILAVMFYIGKYFFVTNFCFQCEIWNFTLTQISVSSNTTISCKCCTSTHCPALSTDFAWTFDLCFAARAFHWPPLSFVRQSCSARHCRPRLHQPPRSFLRVGLVQNVLLKSNSLLLKSQVNSQASRLATKTVLSLRKLPSPCPSSSVRSCFPEDHMLVDDTALQGCWWP